MGTIHQTDTLELLRVISTLNYGDNRARVDEFCKVSYHRWSMKDFQEFLNLPHQQICYAVNRHEEFLAFAAIETSPKRILVHDFGVHPRCAKGKVELLSWLEGIRYCHETEQQREITIRITDLPADLLNFFNSNHYFMSVKPDGVVEMVKTEL